MNDFALEVPTPKALLQRRVVRWGGGTLLGLMVLLVALGLTVRTIIDIERIERQFDAALATATDGRYRGSIEALHWGLLAQSVEMKGISVEPSRTSLDVQTRQDKASRPLEVRIPTLELRDLDLWALLWRQSIKLDALHLKNPHVKIHPSADETAAPPSATTPDSLETDPKGWATHLDKIRVTEGTLVRVDHQGLARDSIWGLSCWLRNITLDSMRAEAGGQYLASRLQRGSFAGARHLIPEDPYLLRAGKGHLAKKESTLVVNNIQFRPPESDEAFLAQHQYRTNRIRTSAERVALEGLHLRALLGTGALRAESLRLSGWELEVYRDNHLPERPNDPPPPMPQELVAELDHSIQIDTMRLRDSQIRYTKRPKGLSQKGSIWFDELWATLYNVTTDPRPSPPARPLVVDLRSRVNGAGDLKAQFRIPMDAPDFSLSFRGRVGPMKAKALNDTFVPLGGVRIEHGTIDSLWFQADVKAGRATGKVGAVYQGLEIETLNKKTGARGVGQRLRTMVVNRLALRTDNVPSGGSFKAEGRIQHTRSPEDTFFKFLWHAVRDGIYSLVGIDRLPR